MPEHLEASDQIVNIWLDDDREELSVTKARIKAIREEYQQTHPMGNYPDVLRDAFNKLKIAKQEMTDIEEITPEDFND